MPQETEIRTRPMVIGSGMQYASSVRTLMPGPAILFGTYTGKLFEEVVHDADLSAYPQLSGVLNHPLTPGLPCALTAILMYAAIVKSRSR